MEENELVQEIKKLKEQKNAVILAHNYQRAEVRNVADYLGDSLWLSKKAAETDKDIIVFCGVHFMAETAKILSPNKLVLFPSPDAGCPMADMVAPDNVEELKAQYPDAAVACYVNTTAAVKAACDICVTSANAVEVINSLKEEQVIFVPDKHLASYIQRHTKKILIPYDGLCPLHTRFSREEILKAKENLQKETMREAKLIAHPECPPDIIDLADYVCSTSGMIDAARQSDAKDFLIATEIGMIEILRQQLPEKNFYSAGTVKTCPNMKRTTLKRVYEALLNEQNERYHINVPEEIAEKARLSLERMLAVK